MTELVTLRQLFDDGKEERFFQIPDYQRGYSWEADHRDDLLNDLNEVGIHKTQHFTGTIVAARPNDAGEHYKVVDCANGDGFRFSRLFGLKRSSSG